MSVKYDEYLKEHKNAVIQAYEWLRDNLPGITSQQIWNEVEHQVCFGHDASKTDKEEYDAYDNYFYGNRSYEVCEEFDYAWLRHIHKNPHHWQYWVLCKDDPDEPDKCLLIPENYILEMICDWWSFSWRTGNLYEIFQWYDDHKLHMKINNTSKAQIEMVLDAMKKKLEAMSDNNDKK